MYAAVAGAGVGLELGEERGRGLVLPERGAHESGGAQARMTSLRVFGPAGGGLEPVEHLGDLAACPAGRRSGLRSGPPMRSNTSPLASKRGTISAASVSTSSCSPVSTSASSEPA